MIYSTRKYLFLQMMLMDSNNNIAINLGETYLVNADGYESLGKHKVDLMVQ